MDEIEGIYESVIGVDPGLSGGIAHRAPDHSFSAFAMPPTEGDLLDLLSTLSMPGKTIAFVEEVGGFAGKQQPGSAMFRFGRNFGFLLGVLQALGVRIELVRPQKWQKPLSLGTASGCASRTEWKNKLKGCAQRLYPALKPTLSTADAILILDFGLKSLRASQV
jgi:crossover junction endodeoxyribonuclease RuvC